MPEVPLRTPPDGPAPALSDEQRRAVEADAREVVLSAAAGSGKTRVLAERVVAAATRPAPDGGEPVRLEQIAAITFTEKAAGELRDRVRRALVAAGEPDLARELERAAIGTIHGFCARLLRRHALAAGIDPGFEVLDERAARRLREQAWEEALDAASAADPLGTDGLLAAHREDHEGRHPVALAIADVHDDLRSQGREPRLPAVTAPDVGAALAALAQAAGAARAEVAAVAADPPPVTVADALEALQVLSDPATTATLPKLPGGNARALKGDAYATCRECREEAVQARTDVAAVEDHRRMAVLLDHYARAYAEHKRARGAMDFNDLEIAARDLLRDHDEVGARVRGRYRVLLVDEFQDTNGVQDELIRLAEAEHTFMVGDEQQSIYGFRHAEVDLLRRARERAGPGAALRLRDNYRSDPRIVAAINHVFADELPGYEPMHAARTMKDPPPDPVVELLVTDGDAWVAAEQAQPDGVVAQVRGDLPVDQQVWRAAEARLLAQRLRELVDAGTPAGDITVLVRAYASMPVLEAALAAVDLRTLSSGGRGYWSQQQVEDLLAWLRLLANPRDEVRLWAVLGSPLVGVSADGLARVAMAVQASPEQPWELLERRFGPGGEERQTDAALDGLDAGDAERVRGAVAVLLHERAHAARRPLAALIARAVTVSGYEDHVLSLPSGARRLANVRKLVRFAAAYEATEGRDLRGFLDAVDEDRAAGTREPESPIALQDDGAVQLMTIHAAKGLEFPVVALFDTGRQPPRDRPLLMVRGAAAVDLPESGMRLRHHDDPLGKAVPALGYRALSTAADAADGEERRRLFYVACTRAEDRLIISGTLRPQGGPEDPIRWLGGSLDPELLPGDDGSLPAPVRDLPVGEGAVAPLVRVSHNRPDTVGQVLRLDRLADARSALPPAAAPAPMRPLLDTPPPPVAPATVSFTGLSLHAACGYRYYLERVARLPRSAEQSSGGDGIDARRRGVIVHRLLERHAFDGSGIPRDDEVLAIARAEGVEPDAAELADLRAQVEAFAASPVRARLAAATGVRREEPFAFPLAPDLPLLVGVLDVVAHTAPGELLVVDYKTNRLGGRSPAEAVERSYDLQRAIYALAALRSGARTVEVAYVFLERPQDAVQTVVTAEQRPDLEERLGAAARALSAGAAPVAPVPNRFLCDGCPGRGTLCPHPRADTDAYPAA